jgi:hypothetical protein
MPSPMSASRSLKVIWITLVVISVGALQGTGRNNHDTINSTHRVAAGSAGVDSSSDNTALMQQELRIPCIFA